MFTACQTASSKPKSTALAKTAPAKPAASYDLIDLLS